MADVTPRERARLGVARFGVAAVVGACVEVLRADGPIDGELLEVVGEWPVGWPEPRVELSYWWPTWALRTLLHVPTGSLDADAEAAVVGALGYWHWRPQEMAAKVVVVHEIGAAADELARLLSDETPRVRVAALRGLAVVGEHEHVELVEEACDDPDPRVSSQAERTVAKLRARLDRPER